MKTQEQATISNHRRQFYQFLARLFAQELTPQLISKLAKMTYPTQCKNEAMAEGYQLMGQYFKQHQQAEIPDDLACDYAKVFLGAGETKGNAAFPYESVYTSAEKLVMQEAWVEVKKIYQNQGLALNTEMADIKEDHLAMELKFMCRLAQKEPQQAHLQEQQTFLQNHLLNWIDDFAQDVAKFSQTDFYKGAALLTKGYLHEDAKELKTMMTTPLKDTESFAVANAAFDQLITKWQAHYHVFAPKFTKGRNASQKPLVRFGEIQSVDEIVYDRQSDFSAKEIYYPIMQTMFYFSDKDVVESKLKDDKDFLIFMHPCDINALRRTDTIFMRNGGFTDTYYQRLRAKVKIVMMQCTASYENCFCVSMHSNSADDYNLAVHFADDHLDVQVKDAAFLTDFQGNAGNDYTPSFIQANQTDAHLPEIDNQAQLDLAGHLPYWQSFNERCISCGGCNTVCPTCSCFDTVDVIYDETSQEGERRRVWSSCMLNSFTETAGGNHVRNTPGDNMRFKTLHKVYDYKQRFGEEQMCVGCGRCTQRCPKDISFLETINDFHDALSQAKSEIEVNGQ